MVRDFGRVVYGLRVLGLDDVPELSQSHGCGLTAPMMQVVFDERSPAAEHLLDERQAVEPFGPLHQWVLDRDAGTAHLLGPPLDRDLLAHPCLAPAATAFNRWAGRETFHAASFELAGRGYGVIGARTAGKSSLMAGLAARGVTVMSDDIVVTDGEVVFAGPRCVDLRTPFPGMEHRSFAARLGTRWRLPLPAAPVAVPLAGWVFLGWADDPSMQPCNSRLTLARLARWRGRRTLRSDPVVLLALASHPAWTFNRPPRWSSYDESLDVLLRELAPQREPARS